MSFTLSQLAADFESGAAHIKDSASPYLEFHFSGPNASSVVYKSTMIKKGGAKVAWQQPVLLTGANTSSLLRIVAKAHKTLTSDKVIGTGTLDLTSASRDGGFTNVPLLTESGKPGGVVRFVVTQGEAPGTAGLHQGTPGSNGVVEGVGGPGHNVEGGIASAPFAGQQQGHAAGQPARALGDNNAAAGAAPGYDLGQQAPADGVFGAGTAQQQQLSPVAQQGLQAAPPGGFGNNGVGAGGVSGVGGLSAARPHEFHEKRSHNVSDHSENETSEVHHIG